MSEAKHIVAVDLGSNSFHLVIAKENQGRLTIVDRYKQRVSLSSGFDDNDMLSQAAMDRGIECLKAFSGRFSRLPHSSVRIVATHSLRKAANRDVFIKAAIKVLPYPIEIIDGHTEAELIYLGIAHTQPMQGRTLVIDIGGGSTEFIIGKNFDASLKESLDIGSGQLRKELFNNGEITKLAFEQAYEQATVQLMTIADRYRKYGWKSCIGTSGSIKAIGQVLKELNGNNKITVKRLKRLKRQLITWGNISNIPLSNISEEKLEILPSAVAILLACFDVLAIDEMDFSTSALREGVLYGLSESRNDSDVRQRTINSMIKLYHTDISYARRVISQYQLLAKQLDNTDVELSVEELGLLKWAAQLHEVGLNINSKKRQQHGAYIIEHSEMPGFSIEERNAIEQLVKYHRGKLFPDSLLIEDKRLLLLIVLLRLSVICTQGRLNLPVLFIKLSIDTSTENCNYQFSLHLNEQMKSNKSLVDALIQEQYRLSSLDVILSLT